jgi:hypothetical protein
MSKGNQYRMISPTIALFFEAGRHVARTVPSGSIITIESLESDSDELVDVIWNDSKVKMFAQDIKTRGERLDFDPSQTRPFTRIRSRRRN